MLTLYFSPFACSLAPHIALEEAGAKFDTKALAMAKGEHKAPAYLAINPRGQVPTLVVDGKPLTQNVAILTYIAKRFPEAKLMPTGLREEADALSWLAFLTSSVHTSFGPLFAPQRYIDAAGEASFVEKARAQVAEKLADADRNLAGKDYALGTFSVVDAYLAVFPFWAKFKDIDLSRYTNLSAHHQRMLARPAVQRAMAREQGAQAELDKAA